MMVFCRLLKELENNEGTFHGMYHLVKFCIRLYFLWVHFLAVVGEIKFTILYFKELMPDYYFFGVFCDIVVIAGG